MSKRMSDEKFDSYVFVKQLSIYEEAKRAREAEVRLGARIIELQYEALGIEEEVSSNAEWERAAKLARGFK